MPHKWIVETTFTTEDTSGPAPKVSQGTTSYDTYEQARSAYNIAIVAGYRARLCEITVVTAMSDRWPAGKEHS